MQSDHISKLGYLAGATRFRRISEKLYLDGDKIYRDHHINFKATWFPVFYILSHTEAPKTVLELAEEIGFTHITVKNVVRELEAEGLVQVRTNPGDGRSRHIVLSPQGQKLSKKLKEVWLSIADTLKHLLDTGHPDFLNIIGRIDAEIARNPIHEKIKTIHEEPVVQVLDYKPSLKPYFNKLAGKWLLDALDGKLEEEDRFTLEHPDEAYLLTGGFVFYALYNGKVAGCVALKRLDEHSFEFAKLFVDPKLRMAGIATRLIERCITRCRENAARQLWLQTTLRMPEAHRLYDKLGFADRKAPKQMDVLQRTEKIMVLEF